eukprot:TRINITY_DN8005_c0_g1_i2.p1 TRINITY_DN8005_c0_g1~~TRINITY_DN8005_c0_g1_i2.p1  ORF type:complete len:131 (-),score=30.67 TRINITY_DN8005_c0_g1_i2:184-576(-)
MTPDFATEVELKLKEISSRGNCNFGIVKLSEKEIEGDLKRHDGNGKFSNRARASIKDKKLHWERQVLELTEGYALVLPPGVTGEWCFMYKREGTVRIYHFRCRHKDPYAAQRWVGACLLNGARPLRINKN